jgi:hypothetical protein
MLCFVESSCRGDRARIDVTGKSRPSLTNRPSLHSVRLAGGRLPQPRIVSRPRYISSLSVHEPLLSSSLGAPSQHVWKDAVGAHNGAVRRMCACHRGVSGQRLNLWMCSLWTGICPTEECVSCMLFSHEALTRVAGYVQLWCRHLSSRIKYAHYSPASHSSSDPAPLLRRPWLPTCGERWMRTVPHGSRRSKRYGSSLRPRCVQANAFPRALTHVMSLVGRRQRRRQTVMGIESTQHEVAPPPRGHVELHVITPACTLRPKQLRHRLQYAARQAELSLSPVSYPLHYCVDGHALRVHLGASQNSRLYAHSPY